MCLTLSGVRAAGCILDVFLLPSICVGGVALNILCMLVFVHNRRHPLVPALTLLSLCDLLQLFLSLFVLFLPALIDFFELPPCSWTGQIAYLATGLLSPLLLASNCASIWTITYISIERHRAITKPLSAVRSTPQVIPLTLICVLALLFNASKWMEFEWEVRSLSDFNATTEGYLLWAPSSILLHQHSALASNEFYKFARELVLYPLLVYLIPLCLLSGLNLRILVNISTTRINATHKSRLAQERRTISLLISIVALFFFCHTGGLIVRFMTWEEEGWFVLIKDIINILFNVNSLANPMLYFFFTRQFRDLRERYIASHFYASSTRASLTPGNRSSTTRSSWDRGANTTQLLAPNPNGTRMKRSQSISSENLPKYEKDVLHTSPSVRIVKSHCEY